MTLPKLTPLNRKNKQYVVGFYGLNASNSRRDGEMRDMLNLTSDYAPYLSPRKPRSKGQAFTDLGYIGVKDDKFFWVDGTNFIYDGVVKGQLTAGKKQIAVMNDYIIIFPDRVHYDVVNNKFASMNLKITATSSTFSKTSLIVAGANFQGLKKGDAITITGSSIDYNNRTAVIKEYEADNKLVFDENTFQEGSGGAITISREVPELDFVIEAENRLWGCKGNEIFASKLGDHLNFNVFAGISTDSYATSVGTDGPFTAAFNYSNNICFFKEDCIHRVFGSKPSNYQIITTKAPGVQKGCAASMAIANQVLFYKSIYGIMAFNGSLPEIISDRLGYEALGQTIAGSDGKKYYCCINQNNKWVMYVYDAMQNVWHKEDHTQATHFVTKSGVLYYHDAADKKLTQVNAAASETFFWEGILGPFNETIGEKKGYSKLQIRATVELLSQLEIYISHNGGEFKKVTTLRYTGGQMVYALMQIQRCDYFDVKIKGVGEAKIHSITREFIEGSDI